MHTKSLYWMHRFHHQFNSIVLPSTANAVTPAEYTFAYMLPVWIAAVTMQPHIVVLLGTGYCVAGANILIHSPVLVDFSEKYLSKFPLVSAFSHKNHHQSLTKHFAAPIFDVDALFGHSLHEFMKGLAEKIGGPMVMMKKSDGSLAAASETNEKEAQNVSE